MNDHGASPAPDATVELPEEKLSLCARAQLVEILSARRRADLMGMSDGRLLDEVRNMVGAKVRPHDGCLMLEVPFPLHLHRLELSLAGRSD